MFLSDYKKTGKKVQPRRVADGGADFFIWRPQGDSNPRRRRERPVSWAGLDDRDLKDMSGCRGGRYGDANFFG